MASDACTSAIMNSAPVAVIQKTSSNPENFLASAMLRTLIETCNLMGGSAETIRLYGEFCVDDRNPGRAAVRVLFKIRTLVCLKSEISLAATSHWTCWQSFAMDCWQCSQNPGWLNQPQACTTLQQISECYSRSVHDECGEKSSQVLKALVVRSLAAVSNCEKLQEEAPIPTTQYSSLAMILISTGLVNLIGVFLCCCFWAVFKKRRNADKDYSSG